MLYPLHRAGTSHVLQWSRCQENRLSPPNGSNLFTGNHAGQDTSHSRVDEVIGYIAIKEGHVLSGGIEIETGGVTLWNINKAAHRVTTSGQDTDGLGRWAWTQYRGRNQVSLRVVTAYRPVRNTTGAMSVWNQQRSYFDGKDDDRCPRDLFNIHLAEAIRSWMAAGDQLVMALDANEVVRSGTVHEFLLDLGLIEAIIDQHGSDGPSTFEHGSSPIDGLFVSSTLLGLRCGYTGYWHGHRCL
jgi:hypothetical protein